MKDKIKVFQKNHLKKRTRLFFRLSFAFIFAYFLCHVLGENALAADNNIKAHKAYKEAIQSNKIYTGVNEKSNNSPVPFTYYDINRDGIDELITYPGFGHCSYTIYTYHKGEVLELHTNKSDPYSYQYVHMEITELSLMQRKPTNVQ